MSLHHAGGYKAQLLPGKQIKNNHIYIVCLQQHVQIVVTLWIMLQSIHDMPTCIASVKSEITHSEARH